MVTFIYFNELVVYMCSFTVRVSQKVRKCLEKIANLLHIDSCFKVSNSDSFVKCLEDIVNRVEQVVYKERVENKCKCAVYCIDIIVNALETLRKFDKGCQILIKFATSDRDSVFKEHELHPYVKRLVRHVEVNEKLLVLHIAKHMVVDYYITEFINCLLTYCTRDMVREYVLSTIEFLRQYSDKVGFEIIEVLVFRMLKFCKELGIEIEKLSS